MDSEPAMDTMVWLGQPEHVGIIVLIAILQLVFTAVQNPRLDISRWLPDIPARIVGSLLLLAGGWIVYSIPWALLSYSMRFPPSQVFSPLFLVLGGFTVIGAVITRSPAVGGFLGGSVPLAALSLFYVSIDREMQTFAPPLAWFGMFMVFGGLLGAFTGPLTVKIVQALTRTVSSFCIRDEGNSAENDRSSYVFDAFLSHNSQEKAAVRQLAEALKARGIRVWLDEEQLVPGRPWQEDLEKNIQSSRTALILVGKDNLGPWEIPEMRACLSQLIKRRMPVIPVLLPGASAQPELPIFLRELTWVDLRDGLDTESLDRLEWGITGMKPK